MSQRDILNEIDSAEEKKLRVILGISEERMIISVGQFIYRKGFDILIEVYRDREEKIYIVGGKPTNEYLEMLEKYQLSNLHFVEFMEKRRTVLPGDSTKTETVFIMRMWLVDRKYGAVSQV